MRLGVEEVVLEQKQEVDEPKEVGPNVDSLVVNVKYAEKYLGENNT